MNTHTSKSLQTPWILRLIYVAFYILMALLANSLPLIGPTFTTILSAFSPDEVVMSNTFSWISVTLGSVLALLMLYFLWRKYRLWSTNQESRQAFTWRDFGINFLFALGLRVVTGLGTFIMTELTGMSTTQNDAAIQALFAEANIPMLLGLILATVVLAPLGEEFVYRGISSHILFLPGNKWLSIIIMSFIFSISHMSNNWVSVGIYFGMGIILHLAYYRRMDIRDAICVHFLNNAVSIAALLLIMYLFPEAL